MKKKIILTLVLSVLAMLVLCAAAFADETCTMCGKGKVTGTAYNEYGCNIECDNCHAKGGYIHIHGVRCKYCGTIQRECTYKYISNENGTHTYKCINNYLEGCQDKTETVSACSGGEVVCGNRLVCDKCSNEYGEEAEHDWSTWDGENGEHSRVCLRRRCNAFEEGFCSGGEANCVSPAMCKDCGEEYLPVDADKHNFSQWTTNGNNTHTRDCLNGCNKSETADCSGGEATCIDFAICVDCKFEYGEISTTNHGEFIDWAPYDNDYHWRYCSDCGREDSYLYEEHTGGEATCIDFAVCDVCKATYGDVDTDNHGEFIDWEQYDNDYHLRYCSDCGREDSYLYEEHTGGTVNCVSFAICDVCYCEYGEIDPDAHNLKSMRVDDTETHITVCLNNCEYFRTENCSGGKATCVAPANCAGCGEAYGEIAGENGHDYKKKTVEGSCTTGGYIKYTCKHCGDSYTEKAKASGLHWFDLWTSNGDGTHSAPCKREGCEYTGKTECASCEVTIGENTFSVCPVCGGANFAAIEGAEITGENLPIGEAIVYGAEKPFEGVLYAFTAAYEYSGKVEEFNSAVSVSLPVAVEGEFRLVRVEEGMQVEIPYTLEEGMLTFETESAGLFMIVPVAETAA